MICPACNAKFEWPSCLAVINGEMFLMTGECMDNEREVLDRAGYAELLRGLAEEAMA